MESGVRVDLHGKQALVTGGARGLGASISRRLCGARASVLVADLRKDLARDLCNELGESGGEARFVEMDVRDAAGSRRSSTTSTPRANQWTSWSTTRPWTSPSPSST